jgi:preprotein translocase subunit SecF
MEELQQLKNEIKEIKERNARVEADKAWETSLFRKVLVAVLTYLAVVLFFVIAELPKPFINALVPTLGFLLSTLSISFFKKLWLKNKL